MCVPTSSTRLAGIDQQAGVEPALGLGEPVAHLLEPPGQAGIVEGEPDVILDDPEPLAGAIGRGIEDPRQVHAPPGLDQVQRGDVRGHRDRPGVHGGGLRQAVAERLELQAGGAGAAPRRGRTRPSARPAGARCRPRASGRAPGPGSSPRSGPAAGRPTGAAVGRSGAGFRVRRSSGSRPRPAGPWPPAAGRSRRRTPPAARPLDSPPRAPARPAGPAARPASRRDAPPPPPHAPRARSAPAVYDSNISSMTPSCPDPPTRPGLDRRAIPPPSDRRIGDHPHNTQVPIPTRLAFPAWRYHHEVEWLRDLRLE